MKTILLSLLLCLPLSLIAQRQANWDLLAGIDYTYRILQNDSPNPSLITIYNKRQEQEAARLGYRIGINYNRRLTPKWVLKTGLRLVSMGYTRDLRNTPPLRWGSEWNGINYVPDPNLPHQLKRFNYNYYFLEIPIVIRFEMGSGNWRPFLEGGIAPNIYLTSRSRLKLENESNANIARDKNIRTAHLVPNLTFGFNRKLNEHHVLFIQTTGRYHVTPSSKSPDNEILLENLYAIGVESGIRFHFY